MRLLRVFTGDRGDAEVTEQKQDCNCKPWMHHCVCLTVRTRRLIAQNSHCAHAANAHTLYIITELPHVIPSTNYKEIKNVSDAQV